MKKTFIVCFRLLAVALAKWDTINNNEFEGTGKEAVVA